MVVLQLAQFLILTAMGALLGTLYKILTGHHKLTLLFVARFHDNKKRKNVDKCHVRNAWRFQGKSQSKFQNRCVNKLQNKFLNKYVDKRKDKNVTIFQDKSQEKNVSKLHGNIVKMCHVK